MNRHEGVIVPSILPLVFIFLFACGTGQDDPKEDIVAEAYGETLTKKELKERVPSSISAEDSQHVAETSIRNWVREQVLLKEAKDRLPENEKDLEKRIRDYRRSLLIHSLEQRYVKEHLDTIVSEKELREFHKEHRKDLQLDGAILKKAHVQLKKDSIRYLSRFKNALRKDSNERKEALKGSCQAYAVSCSDGMEGWMRLSEFRTRFPFRIKEESRFLQDRRVKRSDREDHIFLLRVVEHKNRKDTAPLSMVRDKVERMIIDARKKAIIQRLHKNALLDARKNNKVRVP